MKKVLIITYYWPPMGGGGVQRWLKFTKYLRDFGWEPVIYTPENADVANYDESLLKEVPDDINVLKTPIWEPFDLYKSFLGKSKEEKVQPGFLQESEGKAFLQKISVWIRGNLFIPDAKKYWIKPSVKYLRKYVRENPVDAIISTGPPHSNHLIALKLKRKTGIKWIADFRDPWTNIDYYSKLMLTSWADRKHHRLEKKVLRSADKVVTVSWSWARDFQNSTGVLPEVVTNGFDPADFNLERTRDNDVFTLTHIGSLNADRNPFALWSTLEDMRTADEEFKIRIRLIGPTDVSVFKEIQNAGLSDFIEHIPHMAHKEVLQMLVDSDALLLPLNDTPNIAGVVPGKLYEYLASKRPILCIGRTDGDSAKIIDECNAGKVFDFGDDRGISSYLHDLIKAFDSGGIPDLSVEADKYSRKNLAGKMVDLLNSLF